MSAHDRPEFALIDWIRDHVQDRTPVTLGIGDDSALIKMNPHGELLVATDMLMEGVHFAFPPATPQLAGRKALAVNLSDIAAMGGRATAAFLSVALPKDRGMQFARDLHTGLMDLADQYSVVLAGGDTNSWSGPLVVNVAVLGECLTKRPVTRSGAKPGDWLFVTGSLGGSLSGHHLTFMPRLREVSQLVELVNLHAMIDVSDGLAADLHHILAQSHVGAILDADSIPISSSLLVEEPSKGSALYRALSDGEDFELLFSVSPEDGQKLIASWNDETPLARIGEITERPGCWLSDSTGSQTELKPLGWTHSL